MENTRPVFIWNEPGCLKDFHLQKRIFRFPKSVWLWWTGCPTGPFIRQTYAPLTSYALTVARKHCEQMAMYQTRRLEAAEWVQLVGMFSVFFGCFLSMFFLKTGCRVVESWANPQGVLLGDLLTHHPWVRWRPCKALGASGRSCMLIDGHKERYGKMGGLLTLRQVFHLVVGLECCWCSVDFP